MTELHDYEPSDGAPSSLNTDPPCRICGRSRSACDLRATIDARWIGASRPEPRGNGLGHKMRFSKP